MKIKTAIDEVVCIEADISAMGPNAIVTAKFGYMADGVKCGEVSYPAQHSHHMSSEIDEKVRALLEVLEADFVKQFGAEKGTDEPREIEGIVKEF